MPMPASYSIAGASRNQQDHAGACTCAFFESGYLRAHRKTTFCIWQSECYSLYHRVFSNVRDAKAAVFRAPLQKQTIGSDLVSATATRYARRHWRRVWSRESPHGRGVRAESKSPFG